MPPTSILYILNSLLICSLATSDNLSNNIDKGKSSEEHLQHETLTSKSYIDELDTSLASPQYANKWLVILAALKSKEEALKGQKKFSFPTSILLSDNYDNLNPGWYIIISSAEVEKTKAQEESAKLKKSGFDNYIKLSGNLIQSVSSSGTNEGNFGFTFVACNEFIILKDDPEENWVKGEFELGEYCKARAEVELSRIPDLYKNVIGEKFVVYDRKGKSREAEITGLNIIVEYVAHFGRYQEWDTMEEKDILEEHLSNGVKRLAARLNIDPEFQALYAHSTGNQKFSFYQKSEDTTNNYILRKAFFSSALNDQVQRDFENFKKSANDPEYDTIKHWFANNHSISYSRFISPQSITYSSLRVYGGDYGYGGFDKNVLTFWKIPDNKPELIFTKEDSYVYIEQVMDIDNDNKPEIVLTDMQGYYLVSGKTLEIIDEYTYPNYDCPF